MATAKLFLGLLCFAFIGRVNVPHRNLLKSPNDQVIQTALGELGVRELTGNNDGARVETYLKYTGLSKGNPWCAAFLSWVFKNSGFDQPRTAWSPDLFPKNRLVKNVIPGLVFGIYFKELGRIAHCGLVVNQRHDWISSVEGNTNSKGSREGDGVYRKLRHIKTIRCFAEWRPKVLVRKEASDVSLQ